MSTILTPPTAPPDTARIPALEARAKINAVCLVGGAVALAFGRVLANNGGSPADWLHQVSGHHAQITASALLAMAGFTALIPGFLAVASRVQRRGALLATIGAGLTVLGCAGFVALVALDDFPTIAATEVGSFAVMADFRHHLDYVPALLILGPLAAVGYYIGPFLVTLGAKRAGLVPRWLPWCVIGALVLQSVGLALAGGPGTALHLLDALCQLALVGAVAILAHATLIKHTRTD